MTEFDRNPVCITCRQVVGLQPGVELDAPALLLERGRVAALGGKALEAKARRVDLPNLWISPALLDTHVHLWLQGTPGQNLEQTRRHGVAAVRDLGNPPAKPWPRSLGPGAAPLLKCSGPGICAQGPAKSWLAQPAAGVDQVSGLAKERIRQGAETIKMFATGLLDFQHPGQVEHPQAVSLDELRAGARVAAQAGLGLAVHASGQTACRHAVTTGASSLEHGFFMDRELLKELARAGTAWSPTLAAVLAHARDDQGRHDPQIRRNLSEIAQSQARAMRTAQDLGVNLVLGTDAGSYGLPHGRAVFLEIEAWLRAGIEPHNVFEAATSRSAG